MATISRESIISSPSRDYAYNLLLGNSSKCDQVWSRYSFINTIITRIKEAYRNWSLDRKCTQVIRSLESKSGEEKAVSELFAFATEKMNRKTEHLGLRSALVMVTYEEMSRKIQERCPQFLGNFQSHYDQYILKNPYQLSMQAAGSSEVFGEWDSVCRRAAACTQLTSQDIAITLGGRFKPEELFQRSAIGSAEVLRNEMTERAFAKIALLMQDPGDKPIDQKRLRDLLGEDIDCLDSQYVTGLASALRKIQMYPHNAIQAKEAKEAYLEAVEHVKAIETRAMQALGDLQMTEGLFASLLEERVVNPLAEAIYSHGDIDSAYWGFIDNSLALARQVQSLSNKEDIKQAVRDHLTWPGFLDNFYGSIESHVIFCLQESSSEEEFSRFLFMHPALLENVDKGVEFENNLWKLKPSCDQDSTAYSVHKYVRQHVKSPQQNIRLWGVTEKELKERILSLEAIKKSIINPHQNALIKACKTTITSIAEGETLRDQLIEKYGALSKELAGLKGSIMSGKTDPGKVSDSLQKIETELADREAALKILKNWMLEQVGVEQELKEINLEIRAVRTVFDALQKPRVLTLEQLSSLASLDGPSLGQKEVEDMDRFLADSFKCQKRLIKAEKDLLRAECKTLETLPLISALPMTLADYHSNPNLYLKGLVFGVLTQDLKGFEQKIADRQAENAQKVRHVVMQNVVDKAANDLASEQAWRHVTAEELFDLGVKISSKQPLNGDDTALLVHMRSHVRQFRLTEEEMKAIEESMAFSSPEWNQPTIGAYMKFVTQYHSKVLNT